MLSHLDARWFAALNQTFVLDFRWLNEFSSVSSNERIKFLENDVENPVFKIKPEVPLDADENRQFWLQLYDEVEKNESNKTVQALYLKKISGQLERVTMLEASMNGDDAAFSHSSQLTYGEPKKKYFRYVVHRLKELIETSIDTPHEEARRNLKKVFSKLDPGESTILSNVLPTPVVDSEICETAEEVTAVFAEVLKKNAVEGWSIEVDAGLKRRTFAVNTTKKSIYVPSTQSLRERKRQLTKVGVKALAEHEVGVHVVRSYRGGRQPLQLLSVGLPNYLRGEEGVASYRQQLVEGATEYYGFDRYLAACLVVGLDGNPRDFRALFEILEDYYLLTLPNTNDVIDRARGGAWDTCVRVFRGTTGQSIGCLFSRDISYLEGNVGIWQLLQDKPDWEEYLTIGKYDPLNQDHVSALKELEILPA